MYEFMKQIVQVEIWSTGNEIKGLILYVTMYYMTSNMSFES